jgi:hypothetical protein
MARAGAGNQLFDASASHEVVARAGQPSPYQVVQPHVFHIQRIAVDAEHVVTADLHDGQARSCHAGLAFSTIFTPALSRMTAASGRAPVS